MATNMVTAIPNIRATKRWWCDVDVDVDVDVDAADGGDNNNNEGEWLEEEVSDTAMKQQ